MTLFTLPAPGSAPCGPRLRARAIVGSDLAGLLAHAPVDGRGLPMGDADGGVLALSPRGAPV